MTDTFEAAAGKLAENELALGRLYDLFARTFPADRDLWIALAGEEQQHAEWIREAIDRVAPETRLRPAPAIRPQAIATMIQYVSSIAARCQRGELTRRTALALARDLENSLLENKLLDALKLVQGGVDTLLIESTSRHRKRIADALQNLRE